MAHRFTSCVQARWCVAGLFAVFLTALAGVPAQAADGLEKVNGSLALLPADTAFYSSMLRNREQIETIRKSKAWAKLWSLPALQMAWQMGQAQLHQPDGPFAKFMQLYQLPENRQLVGMLADMGSDEIFIAGGKSTEKFINLAQQIGAAIRFGPALSELQGEEKDKQTARVRTMLETLQENLELIKVPDLIIGFKITDVARAQTQLKRLQGLLPLVELQVPSLRGKTKHVKVGGGSYLTLYLDGGMVPWDQIWFKDFDEKPGERKALIKRLRELKLTLSLGIRDNYLLIALGESNHHLAQLGKEKGLAGRAEFKPLAKFADRRLTSIYYVSKTFNEQFATNKQDVDGLVQTAQSYLAQVTLPEEARKRIEKDIKEFAKDVKSAITEAGAGLGFSFLTDRGNESYSYDWSEFPDRDAVKPLTLLNYVGGSPIFAAAARTKYSPESYTLLVKWIKKANGYVEDFVVPNLNEAQQEHYGKVTKAFYPLVKRLDEVTGKMLLPGFATGQIAFVLDAKIKSKKWFAGMPELDRPLPMLEPALVLGVSNAVLVRKAGSEYLAILNEAIAKGREVSDGAIPEFEIPAPQTKKIAAGDLYYYALPEMLGLDKHLAPNAGLSEHVAVLAISLKHSERLLAKTPLKTDGGPLGDSQKPMSSAVYLNWEGLVDAIGPWVEMGVRAARSSEEEEEEDAVVKGKASGKKTDEILQQTRTVLDVLKVLRSYSSGTYFEEGARVTHSETVAKDL